VEKKTVSHVGLHLEVIVKRSAEIFYDKKQVEGLIKWNEEYMGSNENAGSVPPTHLCLRKSYCDVR